MYGATRGSGSVEMVHEARIGRRPPLAAGYSRRWRIEGFRGDPDGLNLSALPISGYVTALEQRLGVRLRRRGCSGFALTDKGTVDLSQGQRLFG